MCMGKTHAISSFLTLSKDNPHVHGEDYGMVYDFFYE